MAQHNWYYLYLLQQCQSENGERRLAALGELEHQYLDLIEPQFLLDRLNSTSHWEEQQDILGLMCQMKKPLPIEALMTILADGETSSVYLRMEVARTLAYVKAEQALDLVLRLILDADEEVALRETLVESLATWGERIHDETLLALLADPDLCAAALHVWSSRRLRPSPLTWCYPFALMRSGICARLPSKRCWPQRGGFP